MVLAVVVAVAVAVAVVGAEQVGRQILLLQVALVPVRIM
jgi:hypothetical protein